MLKQANKEKAAAIMQAITTFEIKSNRNLSTEMFSQHQNQHYEKHLEKELYIFKFFFNQLLDFKSSIATSLIQYWTYM